jgi:hypothetical protein
LRRELWVVATLGGLAVLRVLVFASAFPFFHNVDEHLHVDAVLRYSRGELPGAEWPHLDSRVGLWAVQFGSYEYLESGPEIPPPPLRREGATPASPEVREAFRQYSGLPNVEFDTSPAAYYLTGLWYATSALLGLGGSSSLYWIRCLNAVILGLLVVGSYLVLRGPYHDASLVRLGVPALLAFFPQDAFFGITPDNLSALAGALAFVGLARLATGRLEGAGRFVLAGLAVSLALLVKFTNGVYLVLAGVASLLWARGASGRRRAGVSAGQMAGFWAAALVPIALWFTRNALVLGEITGTQRKMEHLEWAPKALSDLFDHPLFTPSGALGYLTELLAVFWRGEFLWHGAEMRLPWLDALYGVSSLVLLLLAAWGVWRGRERDGKERWTLELLAVLAVIGAVAQLALLSLRFEFASWGTPTRDHPFFIHGRLMMGVLLPFGLVYVRGLQLACARLPGRARELAPWGLLAVWLILVTACEIALNAPAFESPYNWYNGP